MPIEPVKNGTRDLCGCDEMRLLAKKIRRFMCEMSRARGSRPNTLLATADEVIQ